ncbi:MAG: T9SS type A sorting domain-containing protein [Bacteroidetes bacterium]|nr:T9SS type A sorting domain-containing protein [Bacteroidota bacterium]
MVHFGENEWPILDEYRWPIMMRIYKQTHKAKITTGINLFPCVKSAVPAYFSAWWTNSINADINDISQTYGPADGYVGWFFTAVSVGVEEYFDKKDGVDLIELFPNPTNDNCFIALNKSFTKNVTIEVYNQLGQLLINQFIPTAFEKTIVPLNVMNYPEAELSGVSH